MTRSLKISLILLCSLMSTGSNAQMGIPSDGREYFIGLVFPSFYRQATTGPTPQYSVNLQITSAADNNVSITYFDGAGIQAGGKDVKILAHQGTLVQLDYTHFNATGASEQVQYGTCHIVAKAPIGVQVISMGSCAGGGFQALPVSCLGKQYVVQSYNDNPSGLGGTPLSTGGSRGFFQIIATEDATQVTITPSTTTAGGHTGAVSGVGAKNVPVPFSIGLGRGQLYTVFSAGKDPSNDLTGSVIEANKPIAVLAGHENAYPAGSMDVTPTTEERDLMIEQLLPVESWDTTGYIAVPLVDSKPATAQGAGGEMRVVVYPGNGNAIAYNSGTGTTGTLAAPNYGSAATTAVTTAMRYFDKNKKPFGVMMYDQRQQGTSSPYPAPSMMSIVPRSRWKSEYYFYVPQTKYQVYERYLYIVAPKADWNNRKIMLSFNGASPSPILSGGATVQKMYNTIPGDSSLVAAVLTPASNGAYYLYDAAISPSDTTRRSSFMAYFSGSCFEKRNKMPDVPNDSDDYFEFANPLGMSYGLFGAAKAKLTATVDNLCGSWNVCIQDSGDVKTGIRYIELLNYSKTAWNSSFKTSRNVRLSSVADSLGTGSIVLPGSDKSYCFSVSKINAADSTYAQIEAYDVSGASIVIDLTAAPSLKASSSGSIAQSNATTFVFATTPSDSTRCGVLNFLHAYQLGEPELVIDSLKLTGDTKAFVVTPNAGPFPLRIAASGSLAATVCFSPGDTQTHRATLTLFGQCGRTFAYSISGKGASGLLRATDVSFSATDSGDVTCDTARLTNVGTLPVVLQRPLLSDSVNFSVDPAFLASLPQSIEPGQSLRVRVCFNPQDHLSHSGTITWRSNIPEKLSPLMKNTSLLSGAGYTSGAAWSPSPFVLQLDSTAANLTTSGQIFLANRGTLKRIFIKSVAISGPDSAEFAITDNAYGIDPISSIFLPTTDSMWIKLTWSADRSKGFFVRSAFITCVYDLEGSGTTNASVIAPISGKFFGTSGVPLVRGDAGVLAAQYHDRSIVIAAGEDIRGAVAVSMYDLLGRKVLSDHLTITGSPVVLAAPNLSSGAYILRLEAGGKQWLAKLTVE